MTSLEAVRPAGCSCTDSSLCLVCRAYVDADLARQRVQAYERGECACDGDPDYHEEAASCIWR